MDRMQEIIAELDLIEQMRLAIKKLKQPPAGYFVMGYSLSPSEYNALCNCGDAYDLEFTIINNFPTVSVYG